MIRIIFNLRIFRSKKLLTYLVLLHLIMLITVISLLAVSWWSVAAIIGLGLSLIYYCQRYQWMARGQSITQIERDADDKWYLIYANGSKHSQLRLTKSFILPQLAVLSFRGQTFWQCYTITIIDDAVKPELFRQLRIHCRDPKTFQ